MKFLHDLCKVWILCCLNKSLLLFGSTFCAWKCKCSYCVDMLKLLLNILAVFVERESGEEAYVSVQGMDLVFSERVVVVVWFNMSCVEVQVQPFCCYFKAVVAD